MYVHEEVRRHAWVWFSRNHLPFSVFEKGLSLTWVELARKAALTGCLPGLSLVLSPGLGLQEQATLPGFSTWLLVIKVRYTTETFPQYLSICLFFLEISNPFLYLKLTWWYRKSPDSLSPQWECKFLYIIPCLAICWNRWSNTKALLLQYDIILTVWHHPRICLQCSKTLLCSTCHPHLAFY